MSYLQTRINLEGDKVLLAQLQGLERAIGVKLLVDASHMAIEPVMADAKKRVRVSQSSGYKRKVYGKGGRFLYSEPSSRPHLRDAMRIADLPYRRKLKGEARITRTQEYAYANPLEHGAKAHRILTPWPLPGRYRPHVVNHPGHRPFQFLRPAYMLNWRKAVVTIQNIVREAVLARVNVGQAGAKSGGKTV